MPVLSFDSKWILGVFCGVISFSFEIDAAIVGGFFCRLDYHAYTTYRRINPQQFLRNSKRNLELESE